MMLATLTTKAAPPADPREDQFNVFAYAVRGPIRSNPAFDTWSTNVVWKLYTQRTLADMDVGHRLMTEYITQPSGTPTNETLWLVVRVTSKPGGPKVSLKNLRFTEQSFDPGNTLSNLYDLTGIAGLIYTSRAIGVTWNGGERLSDSIDDHGDGAGLKDEVCFIGMQSPYYPYSSADDYTAIDGYVKSFTNANGFELVGRCEVVVSNTVLALGQRTLQVLNDPIPPIQSIQSVGSSVYMGFNMQTNRTAVLRSTANLTSPYASWDLEGTVNAGDIVARPDAEPRRYFRLVLEPW